MDIQDLQIVDRIAIRVRRTAGLQIVDHLTTDLRTADRLTADRPIADLAIPDHLEVADQASPDLLQEVEVGLVAEADHEAVVQEVAEDADKFQYQQTH